jgi:hypothetical protein
MAKVPRPSRPHKQCTVMYGMVMQKYLRRQAPRPPARTRIPPSPRTYARRGTDTWGDNSMSDCRSYCRAKGPGSSAGLFPCRVVPYGASPICRGSKGFSTGCGLVGPPRTPGSAAPTGTLRGTPPGRSAALRLGFGRIVASETAEAPNMLANLVWYEADERQYKAVALSQQKQRCRIC